jgi:hypothetical protein
MSSDPHAELRASLEPYNREREKIIAKIDKDREVHAIARVCTCGANLITRFGVTFCPECNKITTVRPYKFKSCGTHARARASDASSEKNPLRRFAYLLTKWILEAQGFHHNIVFCNMRGAMCEEIVQGFYQIRYGRETLTCIARAGYTEDIKRYRHLFPRPSELKSLRGVWALVIHECAHAIQMSKGQRKLYSVHNDAWARAVRKLMRDFPFEEVEHLALP